MKRCVFVASQEVRAGRRDFSEGHNYQRWILHALFRTKSRHASSEWQHQNALWPKKIQSQASTRKRSLTVYIWDHKGMILEHYLEQIQRIKPWKVQWYASDQLKPPIQRKCHGLLPSGVCLQHDHAQPHTVHYTMRQIQDIKLEVFLHSPYSPDLASSNLDLFWSLKDALHGRLFRSDAEVKETRDWRTQHPQNFFSQRIYALVEYWRQCVEGNA